MSIALNVSLVPTSSLTVRQFRLAMIAAFLAVAAACVVYIVEKFVFEVPKRFVENPTDIMVRAFGVAHFLIAWLYMATSRRYRSWVAARRIGLWGAVGALLCVVYSANGASSNPIMAMIFYSFFLVHEIRDQADLFIAYGDGAAADARVLSWLRTSVCLLFVVVLAAAYLVNGLILQRNEIAARTDPRVVIGAFALALLLAVLAGGQLLRVALQVHGLREFVRIYAPLLMVYGSILGVLLLGSVLGSVGFNLIILMHATSWLVFVRHQLGQRSPDEPARSRNPWRWLRTHPGGFVVLHLGLVVVVMVLLALRVYVWQRGGVVSVLLSSSNFPYWGFMHIALSFVRTR